MRRVVHDLIPIGELGLAHRAAAKLLHEDGADPESIAPHLLATDPAGDPAVVEGLRAAAARSLRNGAPDAAASYLRRALAEPPATQIRPALLVLGDGLCSFNPVYGQGMTVAARQAETLSELLGSHLPGDLARLTRRLQGAMASVADGAWMVSTGEDLRYPSAEGARVTARTRITHRYMDRVLAAVAVDPVVNSAFLRVLNMIDPPRTLFRPRTMIRVLVPRGTSPGPQEAIRLVRS